MSANEMPNKPTAEQAENIGTRVAKRLSKRLSMSSGNKEGTSHGGGQDTILDRSASIRDEMSHGNFNGAKEIITGGKATKEPMSQGDAGGASSSTGINKQDMSKENAKETGQSIGKGMNQETPEKTYTGESNTEQRNAGGPPTIQLRKDSASNENNEKHPTGSSDQKEQSQDNMDHRGSVAAGMLEPNYDIRKGPITVEGTFQEKNYHNKTGRETIMKRDGGVSSKSLTQEDANAEAKKLNATRPSTNQQGLSPTGAAGSSVDKSNPSTGKRNSSQYASAVAPNNGQGSSSQLKSGGAKAENDFSNEFIQNELHDQENISGDVFDDGTGSKGLPKKAAGHDMSKKSHVNKKDLEQQDSKTSQKSGVNQAAAGAAGAAAIGGSGMSKGTSNKPSTTKDQSSKSYSTSGVNEMARKDPATINDLTSTSPKSKSQIESTASGYDHESKGLVTDSQAKKSMHPGAILGQSSDQGFNSATPAESAYSSIGGMGQTSGLRSTTTSQTNHSMSSNAFSSTGGTTQAALVGGGRLQQTGVSGGASKSGVSNATGAGILPSTTGAGGMNGATTKRTVRQLSSGGFKVTVLQEKVQSVSQKCKTQLGLSSNEISRRSPTVDSFFDAVATERLRWMPRDGSKLDCCLRWASRLAYAVDALRESVGVFAPAANEAAMLIWGFSILLLESDLDNTDVFESVFGRYGRVAVGIYLLLQYETAYKSSPDLQPEVAAVFADLLEMVCSTTTSCVEGFKSKESDQVIGRNVDAAFVTYAKRYSTHWNCVVDSHTGKLVKKSSLIYSSPELGSLRQFLGVQDRPLQFILDSRAHALAEGSFEWFNNTLYDFSVASTPVMLITGGAGSGKSAMAQWTVERLQESAEHDSWNVIPYTIREFVKIISSIHLLIKLRGRYSCCYSAFAHPEGCPAPDVGSLC
jgi:hypothetical protein